MTIFIFLFIIAALFIIYEIITIKQIMEQEKEDERLKNVTWFKWDEEPVQ
tara:strand:- start:1626 stop:1775 length:150 start_codon:yes stop_codon:yes gene_type:complete